MNVDTVNSWVSPTARAVAVQEELDFFKEGKWKEGLREASINRLKVITALAFRVLVAFELAFIITLNLMKRVVSFKNYVQILTYGSFFNISCIAFEILAFPLTELVLHKKVLYYYVEFSNHFSPYLSAGLKTPDQRNFEKYFWNSTQQTKKKFIEEQKVGDDLDSDPDTLRIFTRMHIVEMLSQLKVISSQDYFEFHLNENSEKVFSVAKKNIKFKGTEGFPDFQSHLGIGFAQAIPEYQNLDARLKPFLKQVLETSGDTTTILKDLTAEQRKSVLFLFQRIVCVENYVNQRIFNKYINFENGSFIEKLFAV